MQTLNHRSLLNWLTIHEQEMTQTKVSHIHHMLQRSQANQKPNYIIFQDEFKHNKMQLKASVQDEQNANGPASILFHVDVDDQPVGYYDDHQKAYDDYEKTVQQIRLKPGTVVL